MDSAAAGLIGAVIGACVVLVNSVITNRHQLALEAEKARLGKQAELSRELRSWIADVAHEMLSVQHSMEWVCWFAFRGASIGKDMISSYQSEIHLHFPKLLGNLAVVASLNMGVYEKLASLAETLYGLDSHIAIAMLEHEKDPDELSRRLASLYPQATALYETLPKELTGIINSAAVAEIAEGQPGPPSAEPTSKGLFWSRPG